jgi:hypothetical protein
MVICPSVCWRQHAGKELTKQRKIGSHNKSSSMYLPRLPLLQLTAAQLRHGCRQHSHHCWHPQQQSCQPPQPLHHWNPGRLPTWLLLVV